MSKENSNTSDSGRDKRVEGDIVANVSDVVVSVLGIGAAVAKTFAEASSSNTAALPPQDSSKPINAMVHYGMIGMTNIVSSVVSSVSTENQQHNAATQQQPNDKPRPQQPVTPVVTRGTTLRIPLSIENPGDAPMQDMAFNCFSLETDSTMAGEALDKSALSFQPEILNIAAKDFEKLTVFIETTEATVPGNYTAIIGIGSAHFETKVSFEVVASTD